VRLKDECRTIYGGELIIEMFSCCNCNISCTEKYSFSFSSSIETYNDTWSVKTVDWGEGLLQEYDRPVYFYQGGHPKIGDTDLVGLTYSGDRWFGVQSKALHLSENFQDDFKAGVINYHGE